MNRSFCFVFVLVGRGSAGIDVNSQQGFLGPDVFRAPRNLVEIAISSGKDLAGI
jgi:hypothetical protein